LKKFAELSITQPTIVQLPSN